MLKKWKLIYPAYTGEEVRRAYVYIPAEAQKHPERRYPVLYMFDGHNVFYDRDATYGKSWGMKKYMDRTKTPVIIAAIECNHSPDGGRLSEYAPFSFDSNYGYIEGRGRETMEWLLGTFKPMIDREFPTLPDRAHTFIAGSSMGGLMSLYAITEYNRFFKGAACLSPSIWFSPDRLDASIKASDIAEDTVIYMDYGACEMPNHRGMQRRLSKVASLLFAKRADLTFRIVPGGTHSEASWEKQIPFFMNTLFYEA